MRPFLLISALLAAGCAPPEADESAAAPATETTVTPQSPRVVLRDRVVFEGAQHQTAVLNEPFSHMARRWHAYPMTLYRRAQIGARLETSDAAMHAQATVWLFGPAKGSGQWPEPRLVTVDGHGAAELAQEELAPGRYVFVVGPRNASGFLPRYPADVGIGTWSDGASGPQQFGVSNGAWSTWRGADRYRVLEPLPGNETAADPEAGAVFQLEGPRGEHLSWTLSEWSKSTWFVRDDGADRIGDVGNLRMDESVLDIDRVVDGHALPEEADRYVVLRALGLESETEARVTPAMLRVVPETIDGRLVEARPASDCAEREVCNLVHYRDDGSAVPLATVNAQLRGYKPTFYDPGEASSYELTVMCESGCTPPPAHELSRTKYPVYYAHGFNSSKLAWSHLLLTHIGAVPGMQGYYGAENVDPFRPVALRAEQLRRNLRALLLKTEAERGIPQGERMLRVNVVAHSMGGLDARFLMGDKKYNEACGQSQCTAVDGSPESCCAPPDLDGNPTTWRARIASLTTLSTPHCGSSFADLGVSVLENGTVHDGFELVAKRFFGLDVAGRQLLEQTLFALSQKFCAEYMAPGYPAPDPKRVYSWECAADGQCTLPAGADAPPRDAQGHASLPPPKPGVPTIFSWAGMSCVTGSCGDIVDPALLPSYLVVDHNEGDNDGVVSVKSAEFGIYMGVLPHDHFDWTRTEYESTSEQLAGRLAGWLFGVRKEPVERFHLAWLDRLRAAGY